MTETGFDFDYSRQPYAYERARKMIRICSASGWSQDMVQEMAMTGATFDDCMKYATRLNAAFDVELRDQKDEQKRLEMFVFFNDIYGTIRSERARGLDAFGGDELVARLASELGRGNEGWELLKGAEKEFYKFLHDMKLFREMKAQFLDCKTNPDVANYVVRPLVVKHIVSAKRAVSEPFISAVIGLMLYPDTPTVNTMRGVIHTAIADLETED